MPEMGVSRRGIRFRQNLNLPQPPVPGIMFAPYANRPWGAVSTMTNRSDPELIKACQRGDSRAWDQLVDQYGRLVYSIPRRYGLNESDADDVFAAVWATAFKSLQNLRNDTRLSAWLITTTHRECWRVGKKRGTYRQLNEVMPNVVSPADDDAHRWEQQYLVGEALHRLGGRCEELLRALFSATADPNYIAIAQQLDIPLGSIGPTRARCFQKLQRILADLGLEPDKTD